MMEVKICHDGFHGEMNHTLDLPRNLVFSEERMKSIWGENAWQLPKTGCLLDGRMLNLISRSYCGMSDCSCGDHLIAILFDAEQCSRLFGLATHEEMFLVRCDIMN